MSKSKYFYCAVCNAETLAVVVQERPDVYVCYCSECLTEGMPAYTEGSAVRKYTKQQNKIKKKFAKNGIK